MHQFPEPLEHGGWDQVSHRNIPMRFLFFGISENGRYLVIPFTETEYAIRIIFGPIGKDSGDQNWWEWEIDLTPHLLKRMEDRDFSEFQGDSYEMALS
ncbi:hypothetical protein [uncultured Lamprocystis sp.]|jgi:hypothetical protein|uniref:hypothetical protein n=1 Tax=uncultured Lamprocystis sp. TaxID=543132 RepID=UPI0025D495F1|nr:hypothetical protein [uncultured Lamprocystis sp.]